MKRISGQLDVCKTVVQTKKMHINIDKTTYMVLGTRYKLQQLIQDAQFLKSIIRMLNMYLNKNYWASILMTNDLLQAISINHALRFHRK